ncbi:MAG: restriction endonuclease [Clostridia bacterium]|nr:restriction endonuclease [Clostridia bacterium]
MDKILRIPFEQISTSNLIVDAIYEGGTAKNLGSEVLSKILRVGNSGGFRKCMKRSGDGKRTNEEAYVCIYSSGEEIEWRDELDRTLGRFTYWGDNRKAGNPLLKTKFGGNMFLEKTFSRLSIGDRKHVAPVFVFQKYCGRDMIFCGVAVPGDRRINPQDALVSVWAQNNEGRYQNYKSTFTILDIPQIDRRWLADLEAGNGYNSQYAPSVWKKWVDKCEYKPLIIEKNPIRYRKANEQLPVPGSLEYQMLDTLIDYFDDPFAFEACACKIAQIMDSNIVSIETTRATRDGGRDAIGKYRVGTEANGIELEFALEAKRYKMNNSVGVKETSRLISRIKHRQFGIFVTTSYVADQAYKEIIEDEHPIVVISGRDIVEILLGAGVGSVEHLRDWLKANF